MGDINYCKFAEKRQTLFIVIDAIKAIQISHQKVNNYVKYFGKNLILIKSYAGSLFLY